MKFITSLALVIIASVNLALAKRAKTGNISLTSCKNYKLSGSRISAQCPARDKSFINTSVNLSNCVTNNNGNLQRGGAYDRSCDSCSFSGTTLKCRCKRMNGQHHQTNVNLDGFMTNNNGTFKNCGTATSSPVPKDNSAEKNANTLGTGTGSGSSSSSTTNPDSPPVAVDSSKQDMERNTSAEWNKCAVENGTCQCIGAVKYGAKKKFNIKNSNGSIRCNNATFKDPIFGTLKACYCQVAQH